MTSNIQYVCLTEFRVNICAYIDPFEPYYSLLFELFLGVYDWMHIPIRKSPLLLTLPHPFF